LHSFRPNVKSRLEWRDLPNAPDTFALIVSGIEHIVLTQVMLDPVALSVHSGVSAMDRKRAHGIGPAAGHGPIDEGNGQCGAVAFGAGVRHEVEAGPRPAREARVGLKRRRVRLHGTSLGAATAPAHCTEGRSAEERNCA